jgi:hypothetical protein
MVSPRAYRPGQGIAPESTVQRNAARTDTVTLPAKTCLKAAAAQTASLSEIYLVRVLPTWASILLKSPGEIFHFIAHKTTTITYIAA